MITIGAIVPLPMLVVENGIGAQLNTVAPSASNIKRRILMSFAQRGIAAAPESKVCQTLSPQTIGSAPLIISNSAALYADERRDFGIHSLWITGYH